MHCEIMDCYLNIFFLKTELKKKTWKVFFWHQSLGVQTGISVSQMTWIHNWCGLLFTSILQGVQYLFWRTPLNDCFCYLLASFPNLGFSAVQTLWIGICFFINIFDLLCTINADTLFFYKNNFIRTKALVLVKNLRTC